MKSKAGNDRSFAAIEPASGDPTVQRRPGNAAVPPILFVDDTCIIVDKPAGQLSVPGRGALAEGSAVQCLQSVYADAMVVHRLDMATSGVMLFARGAVWQRHFSIEFAQRRVDKQYLALVAGRLGNDIGDSGEIDLPLAADWPNRPRQQVDRVAGKPSLTRWRTLGHDPAGAWTRVELTPLTGRSHQLRVHLLAIGHPILGDALYGSADSGLPQCRLMLHANSISLQHPLAGGRLSVDSVSPF